MHLRALTRLWDSSCGAIPYMPPSQYDDLCQLSREFSAPELKYWGLVHEGLRYRGYSVLRCYNLGNTSAEYPWTVDLVNFGKQMPATITRAGTARLSFEPRTLLDSLTQPFLVFTYEADSPFYEFLQPGMLITSSGQPLNQRQQFDVVSPANAASPEQSGILYYFLTRRIPFTVTNIDHWIRPGAPHGLRQFRITLSQPVVMEPGWPVLLLEKDRWMWGVVSQ